MSRFVVVYTPSYAAHPYRLVYDSRNRAKRDRQFKDSQAAAAHYEKLIAEDPSTKIFYLADSLSNKLFLWVLNRQMEICTERQVKAHEISVAKHRKLKKRGAKNGS